jgi:hypothetical protein
MLHAKIRARRLRQSPAIAICDPHLPGFGEPFGQDLAGWLARLIETMVRGDLGDG